MKHDFLEGTEDVEPVLMAFCQVRELFKENLFFSKDPMDRLTLIDSTLPKAVKADAILRSMRREKREATPSEQALIDEVEAAREIIIQVSRQAPRATLSGVPRKALSACGGMIGNLRDTHFR